MKILCLITLVSLFLSACGMYTLDADDGRSGKDGDSSELQFVRFTSDTSVCASGAGVIIQSVKIGTLTTSIDSAAVICDGLKGDKGDQGYSGPQGPAGENGEDGEDGTTPPQSQYQVVQIIDPCGDAPGIYDEIFLKMYNGTILASFSDKANGENTRLSLLTVGSYVTTDGSDCYVTVSSTGDVSW